MRKIIVLIAVAVGGSIAVQVNPGAPAPWQERVLRLELLKYVLTIALAVGAGYTAAVWRVRHDRLVHKWLVPLGILALCAAMFAAQLQSGFRWPHARWLHLGSFSLQPAEFLRLALAVGVIIWLSDRHAGRRVPWWTNILLGLAGFLLVLEGDTSTLLLLSVVIGTTSYYMGQGRNGVAVAGLSLLATVLILLVHAQDLSLRLETRQEHVAPDSQLGIVLTSLQHSKVFGRATGKQAALIPLGARDFFLARSIGIYGRFFGAALFLLCFAIPVLAAGTYLRRSHTPALRVLCLCWATFCCTETLVHASVNLGLAPVMGVNLPFVSLGGSAMLVYLGTFTFLAATKDGAAKDETPRESLRGKGTHLVTIAEALSLTILVRLLTL